MSSAALCFVAVSLLLISSAAAQATGAPGWVTAGNQTFARRYGHAAPSSVGESGYSLYIIGGATSQSSPPSYVNDVYRSDDFGVSWSLVTARAPWAARAYHTCVLVPKVGTLKESLVLVGGQTAQEQRGTGDTWVSDDQGKTWIKRDSVSARYQHASAGYVSNGIQFVFIAAAGGQYYNDIFYSSTSGGNVLGTNWIAGGNALSGNGEFSSRVGARLLAYNSVLYLLGGTPPSNYNAPLRDIWKSEDDGTTWTQVTNQAPWSGRFEFGAGVADNGVVYVVGGSSSATGLLNDLWTSNIANLSSWTQKEMGPLAPSTGLTASVAGGSVVVLGGKSNSAINSDVLIYSTNGRIYNTAIQFNSTFLGQVSQIVIQYTVPRQVPAGDAVVVKLTGVTGPDFTFNTTNRRLTWEQSTSTLTVTYSESADADVAQTVTIPASRGLTIPAQPFGPKSPFFTIGYAPLFAQLPITAVPAISTGTVISSSLNYSSTVASTATDLSISFAVSVPIAVGDVITINLPGFTGPSFSVLGSSQFNATWNGAGVLTLRATRNYAGNVPISYVLSSAAFNLTLPNHSLLANDDALTLSVTTAFVTIAARAFIESPAVAGSGPRPVFSSTGVAPGAGSSTAAAESGASGASGASAASGASGASNTSSASGASAASGASGSVSVSSTGSSDSNSTSTTSSTGAGTTGTASQSGSQSGSNTVASTAATTGATGATGTVASTATTGGDTTTTGTTTTTSTGSTTGSTAGSTTAATTTSTGSNVVSSSSGSVSASTSTATSTAAGTSTATGTSTSTAATAAVSSSTGTTPVPRSSTAVVSSTGVAPSSSAVPVPSSSVSIPSVSSSTGAGGITPTPPVSSSSSTGGVINSAAGVAPTAVMLLLSVFVALVGNYVL